MFYIVIPKCHGNGGWCGSTTETSFPTIEESLLWEPPEDFWKEYNPYSCGSVLNSPLICKTEDPNDSIYYYDFNDYMWKKTGRD